MESSKGKKSIVIFAKTFLPEYTPESIRIAAFVKYMLRKGWEISLFTWSTGDFNKEKYQYLEGVHLKRFKKPITINIPIFSYVVNYLYLVLISVVNINNYIKKTDVQYYFASIPQLPPLIVGYFVKQFNHSLVLIEEMRDIYSTVLWLNNQRIKKRVLYFLEYKLMRNVDKFIYVTSAIKEDYINNFENSNKKLKTGKVILNGYDPEDYEDLITEDKKISKDKIILTYTGSLFGIRSIDTLLKVIGELRKENYPDINKLEINIIGFIDKMNKQSINSIIAEYSLENTIHIRGVLAHSECIQYQLKSTYNLIVTHKSGSEYAIPSKLFEYTAVRRPMIAISSDPIVIELIDKYKLGYYCMNEMGSIKELILKILKNRDINNEFISIPEEFKRTYQIDRILEFITT